MVPVGPAVPDDCAADGAIMSGQGLTYLAADVVIVSGRGLTCSHSRDSTILPGNVPDLSIGTPHTRLTNTSLALPAASVLAALPSRTAISR